MRSWVFSHNSIYNFFHKSLQYKLWGFLIKSFRLPVYYEKLDTTNTIIRSNKLHRLK